MDPKKRPEKGSADLENALLALDRASNKMWCALTRHRIFCGRKKTPGRIEELEKADDLSMLDAGDIRYVLEVFDVDIEKLFMTVRTKIDDLKENWR